LAQDRDQCTYGDEPLGSGPTELVQWSSSELKKLQSCELLKREINQG
jgi:hypothetical protein